MCPKLSAIDVTEKILFERFYLVIGLVQICAMNQLFVCSHLPTVFTPAISRFLQHQLLLTSFAVLVCVGVNQGHSSLLMGAQWLGCLYRPTLRRPREPLLATDLNCFYYWKQ